MINHKKRITVTMIGLLILVCGVLAWYFLGFKFIVQTNLGIITLEPIVQRYFTPDLPGLQPAARFVLTGLNAADTISAWNLQIRTGDDEVLRSFSGEEIADSGIVWDGRDSNGALVMATTRCRAELHVSLSGQVDQTLSANFKLGFGLAQKVGRTMISNLPMVFSYSTNNLGRNFFLNDTDYLHVKAFADLLSKRPDFDVSVWAGGDHTIKNPARANTEALQRASNVRRSLIHYGMSPERIRVNVIPPTPGVDNDFAIKLAIERPLMDVLSADGGGG